MVAGRTPSWSFVAATPEATPLEATVATSYCAIDDWRTRVFHFQTYLPIFLPGMELLTHRMAQYCMRYIRRVQERAGL